MAPSGGLDVGGAGGEAAIASPRPFTAPASEFSAGRKPGTPGHSGNGQWASSSPRVPLPQRLGTPRSGGGLTPLRQMTPRLGTPAAAAAGAAATEHFPLPPREEPKIFSTPSPAPDPDRFTPAYVLSRVAPGFVRDPGIVAKLRSAGRFQAFYGPEEPPPPKPADLEALEEEERRAEAAQRRVPVRRERVGVPNMPEDGEVLGAGRYTLSRWVERVDPSHLGRSGLQSKASAVSRRVGLGGPAKMASRLAGCEYRGVQDDLPWGVSMDQTLKEERNTGALTVGLVLGKVGADNFLPCSWNQTKTDTMGSTDTARLRRTEFKTFTEIQRMGTMSSTGVPPGGSRYETGYRTPRKPCNRRDYPHMRAAGFRTTDRYIF